MKKDESSKEHVQKRATKLQAAFNKAVAGQIGGDKNHGWGGDDSAAVIEEIVAAEMPDGHAPSPELMELVKLVINPSQFRQRLESKKVLNQATTGRRTTSLDFLKIEA